MPRSLVGIIDMLEVVSLAALAPVSLVFLITSGSYEFHKLLNVFFCAVGGLCGIWYFVRAMRTTAEASAPSSAPPTTPSSSSAKTEPETSTRTSSRPSPGRTQRESDAAIDKVPARKGHSRCRGLGTAARGNYPECEDHKTPVFEGDGIYRGAGPGRRLPGIR